MKLTKYLWLFAALALWGCPPTGEICDNNLDDDGNNLIDCLDPVCTAEAVCQKCGNALVDVGEQCDGTNFNGQTCTTLGQGSGTLSCKADCQLDISLCQSGVACGNSVVEAGEQCDDGNLLNGDGCSNLCQIEPAVTCGDGVVGAGEQCDDGNANNNDACVNCRDARCGDTVIETGVETCDDGNNTNGDGCSSACLIEIAGVALLLNEIDYEQVGTDSNEFIEIINPSNAAVTLSQFSLVLMNGAGDAEYNAAGRVTRISLGEAVNAAGAVVATLQPGQFLVIASPSVTINANALRILVGNIDNFQNGEAAFDATKGDAVGILDTNNNELIDALSYEGDTTAGNITGVGNRDFTEGTGTGINNFLLGTPNESDNTNGAPSLGRVPGSNTNNASTDWQVNATPTPGS